MKIIQQWEIMGTDTYLSIFLLGLPFGFNLKSLLSFPSSLSTKSFVPRGRPILVFSLILSFHRDYQVPL